MMTFEELGVGAELVEALAAEGIEAPTSLQEEAVPVLRKGHSALVRGGPGAGVLAAWGVPLLDRLAPAVGGPVILVVVASEAVGIECARSLGRVGAAAGHRVAALGGPWALPGHADVVFGTASALLAAARGDSLTLSGVGALVVSGAGAVLDAEASEMAALLDVLPSQTEEGEPVQRVLVADPVTPAVRAFAAEHLSREVHIPSDAAQAEEASESAPVRRGTLRVRTLEGEEGMALAGLAGELLGEGEARHLLLFFRSEDRAADLGDLLTLHGFTAGEPGDATAPVWLATGGLDARKRMAAAGTGDAEEGAGEEGPAGTGVVAVSVDVPPDADELDRRHGASGSPGVVLARGRELAHLRRIARAAGQELVPFPTPDAGPRNTAAAFADALAEVIEGEDLAPYHLLVEGAVERWGGVEVAAALALVARRKDRLPGDARGVAGRGAGAVAPGGPGDAGGAAPPAAFVRLFLSVGSRDGIGPGELLGAITGESGIRGDQVGRIDVRDTFSRVEVDEPVAGTVIRALNGISIRGRSVRADYDRGVGAGRDGGGRGAPDRGGRPGGGRPGGGGRPTGGRPGGGRPGGGRPEGGGRKGPPRS
jgi:ATP-dependent RNA helicase DeaD